MHQCSTSNLSRLTQLERCNPIPARTAVQISALQAPDDAVSGWQLLQMAKIQTQPQVIYTSSRSDPDFVDALRAAYEGCSEDAEPCRMTPHVRLEKASLFRPEQVHHQPTPFACKASMLSSSSYSRECN
jgi:hypothetical protein